MNKRSNNFNNLSSRLVIIRDSRDGHNIASQFLWLVLLGPKDRQELGGPVAQEQLTSISDNILQANCSKQTVVHTVTCSIHLRNIIFRGNQGLAIVRVYFFVTVSWPLPCRWLAS